jgi:hypothetical protein
LVTAILLCVSLSYLTRFEQEVQRGLSSNHRDSVNDY